MTGLLAGLPLLAACSLLWDAAAARAGWLGLRSTNVPFWGVLWLASVGLAVFGGLALTVGTSPAIALSMASVSLPLHLFLALVLQRGLMPSAWTTEGEREAARVSRLPIPRDDMPVPGLLFEPRGATRGAILLVHGAGAHKTFYSWPMIEALVEVGFVVCAIDLDGHGDNQRVLDFPAVLDCICATVTTLRQRNAWVGIVGISLGGCVAARAVAEGIAVDALALVASPIALQVTPRSVRNERRTLLRLGTWSLHRYAGTLPLIRGWRTERTRARISTVDLIRQLDLHDSAKRIACPLWLCYGARDLIAPVEHARLLAESARQPHLVIVPRATHLSLPLDRRALRALSQWLVERQTTGRT